MRERAADMHNQMPATGQDRRDCWSAQRIWEKKVNAEMELLLRYEEEMMPGHVPLNSNDEAESTSSISDELREVTRPDEDIERRDGRTRPRGIETIELDESN